MKDKLIVTRMAPSPTGEFHIGGMRTLLYNWAFAKKNGGQFVMRIEDTDRQRLVEGATERLLKVVKDYGFSWDQGPDIGGPNAPYVQSERLPLYKKYAQELIEKGHAYFCFCTSERLDSMREEQKKAGIFSTKYDRHCLNLSQDEVKQKLSENVPYVIRLKVPAKTEIKWTDGVLGEVTFNSDEIDDQVLLKSDGYPTYHLGVVVDDHLMGVTHVMRGNEWLPSTPKHILLYTAFGWEPPVHLHLPNLKELGSTKKLSKRFGPVSASGFLEDGYLPEALNNYLMFLGWNPGTEKELFSLDEFVKEFTLEKIHTSDLVAFDRVKLDWYNTHYISIKEDKELADLLVKFSPANADLNLLTKIAPLVKTRMKKLSDFTALSGFFFTEPEIDKTLFSDKFTDHIKEATTTLMALENWIAEEMNTVLMEVVNKNTFKARDFFMDLRIAVTGKKISPPLNESMEILGKEKTLQRLQKVVA